MSNVAPDPAARQPPTFALDAPDEAAFAAQAPAIDAYLLANFPTLRGLAQHRPHFDPALGRTTDPIEHTLEVIAALDTRGLDPADARLLRAATVFHDIGKLLDPFNVRHATDSALLAVPYLADFGLPAGAQADALAVIRHHDVLGRVCQGRLTADEALDLLGTPRLADLTARLTRADVGSIRGLARVLPSIEAAERAVQALFTARRYSQRFDLPGETTPAVAGLLSRLTPRAKLWLALDGDPALSERDMALLEAVAATGSLARAAARLDLPHPTLRGALRAIERQLGLPLLTAQGDGPTDSAPLTPEARELLARWRAFSNGLDPIVSARFRATFGPVGE